MLSTDLLYCFRYPDAYAALPATSATLRVAVQNKEDRVPTCAGVTRSARTSHAHVRYQLIGQFGLLLFLYSAAATQHRVKAGKGKRGFV